jgi:hypothetical protein
MRRNLSLLGLSLGFGVLLWSQPIGRSVAASFHVAKAGRVDAAMAQGERSAVPRLTALLQGLRSRVCRFTTAPSHALPTGAVGFPELATLHFRRQPARPALVQIAVGARTRFPRAPPT